MNRYCCTMLSVIVKQRFFILFARHCQGHLTCNRHYPHLKSADHVTNADINAIMKLSPMWLGLPTFQHRPHKPVLVNRCSFLSHHEHPARETTPSLLPSFPSSLPLWQSSSPAPSSCSTSILTSSLSWHSVFWGERNGREGGRYVWTDKRHRQDTLVSITTMQLPPRLVV